LLLVAFLLVNSPNCHLSLVLASVVQGDAVNCNTSLLDLVDRHSHAISKAKSEEKKCCWISGKRILVKIWLRRV